jgi:predicted ATPase
MLHHEHTATIATVNFCAGTWPQAVLGDLEALERDSAALSAYCAETKVAQIHLLSDFHHAYARAMREPTERNIVAQRAALDAIHAAGGFTGSSFMISNLAEVALAAGDLKRAEKDLQEGLAFVERSGENYWAADLHRLAGQLALRQPRPDWPQAETCFAKAMEVAQRQGARLLELRAATDLAGLWYDVNPERRPEALVAPILAGIEGGDDARDIRNARALLSRSAPTSMRPPPRFAGPLHSRGG